MHIGKPGDVVTVVVTVDADPALSPVVVEHARVGLARFGSYAGFIGGALHVSEDARRVLQYTQWTSEAAYRACIDDPVWEGLVSTQRFFTLVREGRALVDARRFEVVEVTPPTPAGR